MKKITVENLGHINQFVVKEGSKIHFISYETLIATYDDNKNELHLNAKMWDYSNTTRRHFKDFINQYSNTIYVDKKQWLKEIEENQKIKVHKKMI